MKTPALLFLILIFTGTSAREILKFKVSAGIFDRQDCPVSLSLDQVNFNTDDGDLVLYELVKGTENRIPCQLENGHSAILWFILSGKTPKGKQREFILKKEKSSAFPEKIKLMKDYRDLKLEKEGKPILNYRYAVTYPPEGIDPVYRRSGYVHPLVSPGGEVLTRIQAPDHYHHYGIWGPWTKTHINGREVDFWNLAKGEGTVEFAGFISEEEGNAFSGFKALQQHIDFSAKGPDQIAINENLDVRAWNIRDKKWMIDYTTTINCPLDSGIMLDAYRYGGGIGFRATEKWHKDNCTVLTSEGKTRADADGSNARWCIVEGESDTEEGRSGILFMSYPANRMHPEPMRVWPLDANKGRGDMYFEFCPIRHTGWKLEKGTDYSLKYRMIVFDGKLSVDEAEIYWQEFANPPEIIVTD
jgi:hypothetical protein